MPQLSAQELKAAEAEASYTIQQGIAAAFALYFCKLRMPMLTRPIPGPDTSADNPFSPAPFIVDAVYKIF